MKLIALSVGSKEFDQVAKHITKSYPNACIMFIEKIENPPYEKEFNELQSKMLLPNEKILFHGTNEEAAKSILEFGYDPSANRRSAFGKGVYFALNASYSKDYTDISKKTMGFELSYMLINKVLVGRTCRGTNNSVIDLKNYHTQVDSVEHPTIFSVPLAQQILPLYFVGFHKGAT